MIPNVSQLMPLVIQLGQHLKGAVDHYAMLKAAGTVAGPDAVAVFLEEKMATWNPVLAGKTLLDPDTKKAAARFLAGVAVNFTGD